MSTIPIELLVISAGFLVGISLMVVFAIKTVRFHGPGQRKWAPPAVPWFAASMIVGVATAAYGAVWAPS